MLLSKRLYISSSPKNLPNIYMYAEDTTKPCFAEEVHAYVGDPYSTVSSIEWCIVHELQINISSAQH